MPYHDKKPKNMDKLPSKVKQNIINKTNLTPAKKMKLMKHSNHTTILHLNQMIISLKKKKSFLQSHNDALKKDKSKN
tara:strand:+ start:942 stop:1172 length:231 start_codon:yes stop_codon:yes gene_type:complete